MADTTEAVERIAEALNAIRLFAQDSIEHDGDTRATLANLYGIRDAVDNLRGEVDFRALSYQSRALLSERTALLERVERAERESAHLRVQAQSWACEAKTANATINEGYQAITGATGEPGNWNGAEPVKALIARAQAAETKLATLTEALGHVLPWAEIGRFLWEERSICYGDGRTQPHERAIEWGWQQSTPSCSDWKAMRSDVDAWLSSFGEDGGNSNDAPFSDARQALATINYLTAEEE